MRNKYLLMVFICAWIFCLNNAFSQCVPDTVSCKDTLEPGEICPRILPDGYEGQVYSEVFTVIPPTVAVIETIPLEIVKIVVTGINNLPPGLSYEMNAEEFYADTAYCILVSGTPETAGTYDLEITVLPYVYIALFDSVLAGTPVVDDTSLTITIQAAIGLNELPRTDLFVTCGPNPFRHTTSISINSRRSETAELCIYNLLGKMVSKEKLILSPGRNNFDFDGSDLIGGAYLYRVSATSATYTERLIKLKE